MKCNLKCNWPTPVFGIQENRGGVLGGGAQYYVHSTQLKHKI